jgi:hypothetical protein
MPRQIPILLLAIVFGAESCATSVTAQERAIDTARSVLKIRVFKTGIFSAFAHDHEIEAPLVEGRVHLSEDPSVALRVHASELRVLDHELSPGKREDVQRTMEGPEVLDVKRFPEISFQSIAVQKQRQSALGHPRKPHAARPKSPVEVDVAQGDGHYQGSARPRQQTFGITPVAIAGGP